MESRRGDLKKHLNKCPSFPFRCINAKCLAVVTRATADEHTKSCDFTPNIPCPNQAYGCTFSGTRAQVRAHTQEDGSHHSLRITAEQSMSSDSSAPEGVCKHIPITCPTPDCHEVMPPSELAEHLRSRCLYVRVPCANNCGSAPVLRANILAHVKEECGLRTVSCPTCSVSLFARELNLHSCRSSLKKERDRLSRDLMRTKLLHQNDRLEHGRSSSCHVYKIIVMGDTGKHC